MLEPEHHSACYAGNAPSSLFHSENQAWFVRRHFYDKRHFTATTRREHVKHFTKKAAWSVSYLAQGFSKDTERKGELTRVG